MYCGATEKLLPTLRQCQCLNGGAATVAACLVHVVRATTRVERRTPQHCSQNRSQSARAENADRILEAVFVILLSLCYFAATATAIAVVVVLLRCVGHVSTQAARRRRRRVNVCVFRERGELARRHDKRAGVAQPHITARPRSIWNARRLMNVSSRQRCMIWFCILHIVHA